ncbi:O-antigen polymerase [Vibrio cholerae]|uniref:O-antigen polymerase n=1 Tax=Vibrio cholerae TaxID=666 RepID=UPI002FE66BB3
MLNITFDKLISIFLLYGSGLYLTRVLPISPVYILLAFAFALSLAQFSINRINKIWIASPIYLVLSLLSLLYVYSSPINMVFSIFLNILVIPMAYMSFNNKAIKNEFFLRVLYFYIVIFSLDALVRFYNPGLPENPERLDELGLGYLIYKTNSIMYLDSNFVGVQITTYMVFFLFAFGYNKYCNISKLKFFVIILTFFILILFTLSRAAILCAIISIFVYLMIRTKNSRRLSLIIFPMFFLGAISSVFAYFSNDYSFNSKFTVISDFYDVFIELSWYELLFGIGLGNAVNVIGMGGHNLFITVTLEMGLFGGIFLLGYFIYVSIMMKLDSLYTVLPFLILSMSLAGTALTYMFLLFQISIMLKKGKMRLS